MFETFHIAAQYLTTVAISFLEKKEDDSHTNLGWSKGALHTRVLSKHNCILSLDYSTFSLIWSNDVGFKKSLELNRKKHSEIVHWIRQIALQAKQNLVYEYSLHFELPYEKMNSEFVFQKPSEAITSELIQKRTLAQQALENILKKEVSIRVWPHHFDTGAFFRTKNTLGIGLGMAVPDAMIDDFYFYVSGYQGHNAVELPSTTTLEKGSYFSEGWKGFALPVSGISEAEATSFFKAAIDQYTAIE
jgi:hypothetical protein